MEKIGLLESVRKYRPRDNNDPLENFVTEAFAWMLRDCPAFAEYFTKKILENLPPIVYDTSKLNWETQVNFNGAFPDMVCTSGRNALIFEHKTGSKVHDKQLSKYRACGEETYDDCYIVLITVNKHDHITKTGCDNAADYHLCWSDVYEHIENWIDKNGSSSFILQDFMRLLVSASMGPAAPISQDSIRYYFLSANFKKTLSDLIRNVENLKWIEEPSVGIQLVLRDIRGCVYGERHGRIGIEFRVHSNLTIFIGFAVDEKHMGTKPLDRFRGPDMFATLFFEESTHRQYPSSNAFSQLTTKLKKEVDTLNEGWHYCDSTSVEHAISDYKWAPFQIRKSMFDVFEGTIDAQSQADVFFEIGTKLLKLFVEDPNFWSLCKEFEPPEINKAA